jgi:hypothetical protein
LNRCKEVGVKLDNGHWYENVPKLIKKKKSYEGNGTTLWNQLDKPMESSLTIIWIS